MSESNGTLPVEPANRIEGVKPKKDKKPKGKSGNGLLGFIEQIGKLPGKKTTTFTGEDDDAKASITVKSFPGFDTDSVVEAASEGLTFQAKLKKQIGGKTVSNKGSYEGDSAMSVAEKFFGLDLTEAE
jgi:hypothetical protein